MPQAIQYNSVDQLFRKVDWVFGDFSAAKYIGTDGVLNTTAANAPLISALPYRMLKMMWTCAGWSGGTTPSLQIDLVEYDENDQANAASPGYVSVNGSGSTLLLAGASIPTAQGSDVFYAATHTFSSHQLGFFRLRVNAPSGSPTGLIGTPRLLLYGIR